MCRLLPILTLGENSPAERNGPAIWLRCALEGTLPELGPLEGVSVIPSARR